MRKINMIQTAKVLLCLFATVLTGCEDVQYPAHNEKNTVEGIYLKIPGKDGKFPGVIDDAKGVIKFNVDYNYPILNDGVTDLSQMLIVASLPLSATVTPGLGGLHDFTQPISIRVKAGDGSQKDYSLEAQLVKSAVKNIERFSFSFEGKLIEGLVSAEKQEVSFLVMPDVAERLKGQMIVPSIEISPRATISPEVTEARDFSQNVVYTITAQDGTTADWTIKMREPSFLDYGIGYCRKVWEKSGVDMNIVSNLEFRSMAVVKEGIVVSHRYGDFRLFDKNDGSALGGINMTGVSGNLFYAAADADGKLVASIFQGGIYYWKDGVQNPAVKIVTASALGDMGRKIAVKGSLSSNGVVYSTTGKGNSVFKFHIVNGVWQSSMDQKFPIANLAFTYHCTPAPLSADNNSQFFLIDQSTPGAVNLCSADGTVAGTMSTTSYRNVTGDGKVFEFNNAQFLMFIDMVPDNTGYINKGRIKVFDVTKLSNISMAAGSDGYDKFNVFTSEDMDCAGNGNGTGAVAYELSEDGKVMNVYLHLTKGGVAKYELTTIDLQ